MRDLLNLDAVRQGEGERRRPGDLTDVLVLAALVILTAWFGRSFSRTGVDAANVYISELALLVVGVAALVRLGVPEAWRMVRERTPFWGLVLLLAAGVIAAARGLKDWGLELTLHDIGLLEYTLVLPLVVLVASTAARRDLLLRALVIGGVGGVFVFGAAMVANRAWEYESFLADQEGTLGLLGFYSTIAIAWLGARFGGGLGWGRIRGARADALTLLAMSVIFGLVVLSDKRSVWVAGVVALVGVMLLAPRGRRLLSVGGIAVVLALGAGLAVAGERVLGPDTTASSEGGGGGSQLGSEVAGIAGKGDSAEGENTRWRLDYWQELLGRVPDAPVFGVGFGTPSAFVWEGRRYDFRDDHPDNWSEVSGPHNGFIELLYRMGILGLAGMAVVLAAAFLVVRRLLRLAGLTDAHRRRLVFLSAVTLSATAVVALNQALQGPFIAIFFWLLLGLIFAWGATAEEEREGVAEGVSGDGREDLTATA